MSNTKTNGGRLLARGDTGDIECWRTTHRLGVARRILAGLGIEPTWEHSDCQRANFGRMRHECDYRCVATWPEYVTGEMFDLAYELADEYQTEHGGYLKSQAYAAKRDRETARVSA